MRVLAIVHQRDAGTGVFGEQLRATGAELDEWLIAEASSAPHDPASYDAVMAFGGAMHADQEDEHGWLADEKRLLAELIDRGTPLLGACLGAQILCEAVGGDPLLGPLAPGFDAFQWHSYECLPPPGSVVLARSEACAQAFRVGERAWGIQFHAEVTAADAGAWMDGWRSDPDAVRIGLDVEALRAETASAIGAWNELGRSLCGRFLESVATRA
jgi:GMP synthase (glutamine-hydrolysing)